MSAGEKFWGKNSSWLIQLEPGDSNVSFTPRSVSHPLAGNRNLKLCSFCQFMPKPTAARPSPLGSDTQSSGNRLQPVTSHPHGQQNGGACDRAREWPARMRVSLFTLELGNGSLSRLAVLIVLALSLASIQVSRYFIRTWLVGRVECYELSEILLLQAGTSARRLGRAVLQICACCFQVAFAVVEHMGTVRGHAGCEPRTTHAHKKRRRTPQEQVIPTPQATSLIGNSHVS